MTFRGKGLLSKARKGVATGLKETRISLPSRFSHFASSLHSNEILRRDPFPLRVSRVNRPDPWSAATFLLLLLSTLDRRDFTMISIFRTLINSRKGGYWISMNFVLSKIEISVFRILEYNFTSCFKNRKKKKKEKRWNSSQIFTQREDDRWSVRFKNYFTWRKILEIVKQWFTNVNVNRHSHQRLQRSKNHKYGIFHWEIDFFILE